MQTNKKNPFLKIFQDNKGVLHEIEVQKLLDEAFKLLQDKYLLQKQVEAQSKLINQLGKKLDKIHNISV